MKNYIKNSMRVLALAVAASLVFTACNEWTEPESMDMNTPSVESGLYGDYLKNLKAYKAGTHKAVIVTFGNKAEMPASQADHLTTIPDSVDIISLDNPELLNAAHKAEMKEVRKKSTRVVYHIDFATFEAEWTAKVKENPELTEEEGLLYIAERTNALLAICDKEGFDGITFGYAGRSLASLTEEALAVYTGRQTAFFETILAWRATHLDKAFIFIGNPNYVVAANRGILAECNYIVLATDMANNADEITVKGLMAVGAEGVPSDRIVASTQTVVPGDEEEIIGFFGQYDDAGKKVRSIYGCAVWVTLPSTSFTRAGLLIRNAQYDYYDNTLVYRNIREAISIMNPSPKN